jgi:hypothetical protein
MNIFYFHQIYFKNCRKKKQKRKEKKLELVGPAHLGMPSGVGW